MTLAELHSILTTFAAGDLAPADMQARLVAAIADDRPFLALAGGPLDGSPAERLASELIFHFEHDPHEPARRRSARAVTGALNKLSPAGMLELLPPLLDGGRFVEVLQKHQRAIVSRTHFVAAIGATGMSRRLQDWLTGAAHDELDTFAACLQTDDYERLRELTGLPAA